MPSIVVSSFEVMAEYLFPSLNIQAGNPFLIQGYFLQVTCPLELNSAPVTFSVNFKETTDFANPQGLGISLNAEYIDAAGGANLYPGFLSNSPNGFQNLTVDPGQTIIFGIQALPDPSSDGKKKVTEIVQSGIGWRGTASVASESGSLVATPTQRLAYFGSSLQDVLDASVYSVPTVNGGTSLYFG